MSKISTIIDQLRTTFATLMPTRTEIPNPYSLEDNTELYLKYGWGLTINAGYPSVINVLKDDNETREFNLLITKQIFRLENDISIIATESKTLMEDIRIVKNDLLDFDQIEIEATIQRINFISNSGIQFAQANNFSFIYSGLAFSIEYSEQI